MSRFRHLIRVAQTRETWEWWLRGSHLDRKTQPIRTYRVPRTPLVAFLSRPEMGRSSALKGQNV